MGDKVEVEAKPAPKESAIQRGFGFVLGAVGALVFLWFAVLVFGMIIDYVSRSDVLPGFRQRITMPSINPKPGLSSEGWTNHGKNSICEGRPKYVQFTCTPPGSSISKTCFCD